MLDLFKDGLNLCRILDQCLDGGRQQGPETMEVLQDSARLRFVTCQGRRWFDCFRIEREQAREATFLTNKKSVSYARAKGD